MITLAQLIDLGNNIGIDIFGGLNLPEGSPLNRDIIINNIIEKCGLNIPLYADPRIFASAVNIWSAKHQYTFDHVGKIFSAEYSPIENKYYIEEIDTDRDRELSDNTTGTKTENTDINRTIENSGEDTITDENTTSAYNANDYQENNKTTNNTEYGRKTEDNTGKESSVDTETDKNITEGEETKTRTFGHGNVGVTSNNALQIEDYSMIAEYNPYNFISGLFENELTLCIY